MQKKLENSIYFRDNFRIESNLRLIDTHEEQKKNNNIQYNNENSHFSTFYLFRITHNGIVVFS